MGTYNYVSPEGLVVPDTSEILKTTEGEWKDTLGQDISVESHTPQGVLIASDVAIRSEVAANNAALANQFNPNYAGGIFLDDIWALTGGKRRDATYTIIDNVQLAGIKGVVIPSGSRRATTSGDVFQLLTAVTLDNNTGKGVGIFQALEPGPVPAPANTLTVPVQGYTSVGWETSNNPQAGTVGRDRQSDLSAKQERRRTLALQGRSLGEAVYSNVRAIEGVRSISFRENYDDATKTIDGISLKEHSIWVCVDGGLDADIAEALYRSKTGGTGYNGASKVNYKDPIFGQTFEILFDRPTAKPVMAKITGFVNGQVAGDYEAQLKQAVADYANGLLENGEEGFVLGEDVSSWEIGAAANYRVPGFFISKVEIANKPTSGSPSWSTDTIVMGLKDKAVITVDDVVVVRQ